MSPEKTRRRGDGWKQEDEQKLVACLSKGYIRSRLCLQLVFCVPVRLTTTKSSTASFCWGCLDSGSVGQSFQLTRPTAFRIEAWVTQQKGALLLPGKLYAPRDRAALTSGELPSVALSRITQRFLKDSKAVGITADNRQLGEGRG